MQIIDRSFLSRHPTQSTNHLDYNVVKYSLKIEPKSNLNRTILKLILDNKRRNPRAIKKGIRHLFLWVSPIGEA